MHKSIRNQTCQRSLPRKDVLANEARRKHLDNQRIQQLKHLGLVKYWGDPSQSSILNVMDSSNSNGNDISNSLKISLLVNQNEMKENDMKARYKAVRLLRQHWLYKGWYDLYRARRYWQLKLLSDTFLRWQHFATTAPQALELLADQFFITRAKLTSLRVLKEMQAEQIALLQVASAAYTWRLMRKGLWKLMLGRSPLRQSTIECQALVKANYYLTHPRYRRRRLSSALEVWSRRMRNQQDIRAAGIIAEGAFQMSRLAQGLLHWHDHMLQRYSLKMADAHWAKSKSHIAIQSWIVYYIQRLHQNSFKHRLMIHKVHRYLLRWKSWVINHQTEIFLQDNHRRVADQHCRKQQMHRFWKKLIKYRNININRYKQAEDLAKLHWKLSVTSKGFHALWVYAHYHYR